MLVYLYCESTWPQIYWKTFVVSEQPQMFFPLESFTLYGTYSLAVSQQLHIASYIQQLLQLTAYSQSLTIFFTKFGLKLQPYIATSDYMHVAIYIACKCHMIIILFTIAYAVMKLLCNAMNQILSYTYSYITVGVAYLYTYRRPNVIIKYNHISYQCLQLAVCYPAHKGIIF